MESTTSFHPVSLSSITGEADSPSFSTSGELRPRRLRSGKKKSSHCGYKLLVAAVLILLTSNVVFLAVLTGKLQDAQLELNTFKHEVARPLKWLQRGMDYFESLSATLDDQLVAGMLPNLLARLLASDFPGLAQNVSTLFSSIHRSSCGMGSDLLDGLADASGLIASVSSTFTTLKVVPSQLPVTAGGELLDPLNYLIDWFTVSNLNTTTWAAASESCLSILSQLTQVNWNGVYPGKECTGNSQSWQVDPSDVLGKIHQVCLVISNLTAADRVTESRDLDWPASQLPLHIVQRAQAARSRPRKTVPVTFG